MIDGEVFGFRGNPLGTLVCIGILSALVVLPWIYVSRFPRPPRGCTKIGIRGKSQVADQYEQKYYRPPSEDIPLNQKIGKVKALHIHPIKSCGKVEDDKILITRTGPKFDRQFALARWHTHTTPAGNKYTGWNKTTQREFPKMALVQPEIWVPNVSSSTDDPEVKEHIKNGGCLLISFPRRAPFFTLKGFGIFIESLIRKAINRDFGAEAQHTFRLPLNPTSERLEELQCPTIKVQIWADNAYGVDLRHLVPVDVLNDLKSFLGVKEDFAVFRTHPDNYRNVKRNAPRESEIGYQPQTGFADSYPLHILNLASVRNVARYLPSSFGPLDARRFRSNILVTGPPAHSEDNWYIAKIGSSGLRFYLTDHTTRCQLPNVNPATGTTEPYKVRWKTEPLNALLRKDRSKNPLYMEPLKAMIDPKRANRCIDKGAKGQACLGMQAVPEMPLPKDNGQGGGAKDEDMWIRVGDDVTVLETAEHIFGSKK